MSIHEISSAICVLGRGIERVRTAGGFVWRPTRYIERPASNGAHTGYRVASLELDDNVSMIAGAHANVLAAVQIVEEAISKGMTTPLVIFAAGRPLYLESELDTLTEGEVLAADFLRKLRVGGTIPTRCILPHNRNTRDDMFETLRHAISKNIGRITFVTVAVHVARARELLKLAMREVQTCHPLSVDVEPSEEILARRYAAFASTGAVIARALISEAYKRTALIEQQGIDALLAGTYKFS